MPKKNKKEIKLEKVITLMLDLESKPEYQQWQNFDILSEETKASMRMKWQEYYARVNDYWMPLMQIMREFVIRHDYAGLKIFTDEAQKASPDFREPDVLDPITFSQNQSIKMAQIRVRNLYLEAKDLCDELGIDYSDFLLKIKNKVNKGKSPMKQFVENF